MTFQEFNRIPNPEVEALAKEAEIQYENDLDRAWDARYEPSERFDPWPMLEDQLEQLEFRYSKWLVDNYGKDWKAKLFDPIEYSDEFADMLYRIEFEAYRT